MKKSVRLVLLTLFLFAVNTYSQERDFSPTGFRGVEIDKSSSVDVVETLGVPTARKSKKNAALGISSKWWIDLQKIRDFEKLTYKNIAPYSSIDFFFVKNKLLAITLYLYRPDTSFHTPFQHWGCNGQKLLIPDDLEDFFGVKFTPFNRWHFPETPEAFEKYTPRGFMKDEYMMQYYSMTAITDKVIISSSIDSTVDVDPGPRCSVFDREAAGLKRSYEKKFPGQVFEVWMFSRTLEKK